MALVFISKDHEEKFLSSIKQASVMQGHVSVQVALYVLTAVPNLANKIDRLFNFEGRYIMSDKINQVNLSQGERVMAGLAMNLLNGSELNGVPTSPVAQMSLVDKSLRKVYLSALEYRLM